MKEAYSRMLAEWRKVPEADRFGMDEDRLRAVLDVSSIPASLNYRV